jgi:uncharacterized membrane protein YgdD (TMEM256/DUF423 family)
VQKTFLFLAAIMGGLAVILGAFGAHVLKDMMDAYHQAIYEKGVTYQFYHVFALIACSLLYAQKPSQIIRVSYWFFFFGIIAFSGSLYTLALLPVDSALKSIIGPVTPLGGLLFIVAWVLLAIFALKRPFGKNKLLGI